MVTADGVRFDDDLEFGLDDGDDGLLISWG